MLAFIGCLVLLHTGSARLIFVTVSPFHANPPSLLFRCACKGQVSQTVMEGLPRTARPTGHYPFLCSPYLRILRSSDVFGCTLGRTDTHRSCQHAQIGSHSVLKTRAHVTRRKKPYPLSTSPYLQTNAHFRHKITSTYGPTS